MTLTLKSITCAALHRTRFEGLFFAPAATKLVYKYYCYRCAKFYYASSQFSPFRQYLEG